MIFINPLHSHSSMNKTACTQQTKMCYSETKQLTVTYRDIYLRVCGNSRFINTPLGPQTSSVSLSKLLLAMMAVLPLLRGMQLPRGLYIAITSKEKLNMKSTS